MLSFSLRLKGAEALCGWNVTEGGEEGPKGEEPSAGVEHDGSGQRAEAGQSTHHTPRPRGFLRGLDVTREQVGHFSFLII